MLAIDRFRQAVDTLCLFHMARFARSIFHVSPARIARPRSRAAARPANSNHANAPGNESSCRGKVAIHESGQCGGRQIETIDRLREQLE
jgi:hypothetical protein